jgi:hypothetical protein
MTCGKRKLPQIIGIQYYLTIDIFTTGFCKHLQTSASLLLITRSQRYKMDTKISVVLIQRCLITIQEKSVRMNKDEKFTDKQQSHIHYQG